MNPFAYSAITEKNWKANLNDMTPYEPKFTFYSDFAIAEFCEYWMNDKNAVRDTFNRIKESWGKDIKAITEVCLVLNHKIWAFYYGIDSKYLNCSDEFKEKMEKLYSELYSECADFIYDNFKDDEKAMSYYYEITD